MNFLMLRIVKIWRKLGAMMIWEYSYWIWREVKNILIMSSRIRFVCGVNKSWVWGLIIFRFISPVANTIIIDLPYILSVSIKGHLSWKVGRITNIVIWKNVKRVIKKISHKKNLLELKKSKKYQMKTKSNNQNEFQIKYLSFLLKINF